MISLTSSITELTVYELLLIIAALRTSQCIFTLILDKYLKVPTTPNK